MTRGVDVHGKAIRYVDRIEFYSLMKITIFIFDIFFTFYLCESVIEWIVDVVPLKTSSNMAIFGVFSIICNYKFFKNDLYNV